MKKQLILILIFLSVKTYASVIWAPGYIYVYNYGCDNSNYYLQVGFQTYGETNNDYYEIQRTTDPSWSSAILVGGRINGCGTCSGKNYSTYDYGPFLPNTTYYYRVKAVSNWVNFSFHNLPQHTSNIPTIVNWIQQVNSSVTLGSSPHTESSYTWSQESRDMHGATINLIPTEISKIYLEEINHKINFDLSPTSTFINLEVNVDNQGYFNLYSGSPRINVVWQNSAYYFPGIGVHNLKVKYTIPTGTIYYREYDIHVVPKSDALYRDNYCNTIRVWKGSDPVNGTPIILSEGFDAYNTKPEQYYREAGKDLINCLLNKGFNIYVVNYNLNSQSIRNNAAVFQSAIRYVSSINSNKLVIAAGISMGGIINRYACAKAEQDGTPLPISKLLTLDSPHQGAVIDSKLQNYIKNDLAKDAYDHHAGNNDAAKELLIYNIYDPTLNVHNTFFNELNNLNGDGYPHLVKNIAVSFSTTSPNLSTGTWLRISVHHGPLAATVKEFDMADDPELTLAGSFLPKLTRDPVYSIHDWAWLASAIFHYDVILPFGSFYATTTQNVFPTFIPHNSSLDIVNGISKFDMVIEPSITGFHDIIPPDVIERTLNALINEDLYLQNKTISDTKNYIASNKIEAGNNVTTTVPFGNFIVANGSNVTMTAGNKIILSPGFVSGDNYVGQISPVFCDDTKATQQRSMVYKEENENENSTDATTLIISNTLLDNEVATTSLPTLLKTNEFRIYPNPTKDYFIVETESIPHKISVYNNLGVKILEKTHLDLESTSTKIDLSSEPKGVYFVRIESGQGIKVEKIIYQ